MRQDDPHYINERGLDTIHRYLACIHKKNILFVALAIGIISIFIVACYVIPEKYEAASTVFIETNVIGDLVRGIAVSPSMDDRLDVLAYSMQSRNLLLKVIKELDLDLNLSDQANIEGLIKKLQSNTTLKVGNEKKRSREAMNLFTVSFQHNDPVFARDYVNTLVKLYIEENLSAKRDEAYGANRFLAEQIKYFRNKLEKIEEEVLKFRTEKGIYVAVNEGTVVQEIKESEEKLGELQIVKMEYRAKEDAIRKDMKAEPPYTVAIFGGSGNDINERIVMLQEGLKKLFLDYTENHPKIIRVRSEIELLKNKLKVGSHNRKQANDVESEIMTLNPMYQEMKEELSRINYEFAALEVRERYLEKLIESKKSYLREIPAEKKRLADLQEEKNSNKKIYEELVLRLGQSEVSSQMEIQDKGATFRIVDPAVLPTLPVSPNRLKIILLGIVAGIAGAFLTVIFIDNQDRSVKSINTLKQLKVPIIGIIPEIRIAEDIIKRRRKDIAVYSVAGLYMVFVLGIFLVELINHKIA